MAKSKQQNIVKAAVAKQETLIERGYIHSHAKIFNAVSTSISNRIDATQDSADSLFQSFINTINTAIDKSKKIEDNFYLTLGISGPNEFEKKYLNYSFNERGVIGGKDFFHKIYNEMMSSTVKNGKTISGILLDVPNVGLLRQAVELSDIGTISAENIRESIRNSISSGSAKDLTFKGLSTNLSQFAAKVGIKDIASVKSQDAIDKLVRSVMLEYYKPTLNSKINQIENIFMQRANQEKLPSAAKDEYGKAVKVFIDGMRQNLNTVDGAQMFFIKKNASGGSLELMLTAKLEQIVPVEGTNILKSDLVSQDKSDVGGRAGAKSGTDLRITNPKDGSHYNIQIKNRMLYGGYGEFNLQGSIKLDSLISQLSKVGKSIPNNDTILNILKYITANYGFLKKGQTKNMTDASNLIIKILSAYSAIITRYEAENVVDKTIDNIDYFTKGVNNFFIYNGKYLIPMSAVLLSTKNYLLNNKSLQGGIRKPAINVSNTITQRQYSQNKKNYQRNSKGNLIKSKMVKNNEYYTEDFLNSLENDYQDIYMSTTLSGIYYRFNAKDLEEFLKTDVVLNRNKK